MASASRPGSNSSATSSNAPTDDLKVVGTDGDEKRVRSAEADATYVATRIEDSTQDAVRKIL